MKPIILFRKNYDSLDELKIVKKYFRVAELRTQCISNLVIPRYSSLPYYHELERDLENRDCKLINNYQQHRWIANFEYYWDLSEFTAETWTDQDFYACDDPGPFVVKGKTNSRKHQWNKLMFAPDKKTAVHIGAELMHDPLIGEQGIIYRKYVPLRTFEIGVDGLPFSNEWRLFYYKDILLAYGYYWSTADDLTKATIDEQGLSFAQKIANIASESVNFFVLDIAEKEEGGWVLIEINDGTMSGLSEVNPDELYLNLSKVLS